MAQLHDLFYQPTPFVNRREELAEIARLLADPNSRLLTLVGPGGIGKTRLALEAVLRKGFAQGAHFVSLGAVTSADILVPTIANAIGFTFYGGNAKTQLLDYLADKELLLILDDVEPLLEGKAIIEEIIHKASRLQILATAEQPLELAGESILNLAGLAYPTDEADEDAGRYAAVRLFLQCAYKVRSDFTLSDAERPYVVRICRILEGMPLGIELATPWLAMVSAKEVAEEIEHNLDFLVTPVPSSPRHRSLRATFEHSWNNLPADAQPVLAALSIFRTSFTEEAAAQVANATAEQLQTLTGRSFLRQLSPPAGQTASRYQLPAIFRLYALEKLRAEPAGQDGQPAEAQAQSRHCDYYAHFLQQRTPALQGEGQAEAIANIAEEIENARAAWNWAISQASPADINSYMDALFLFYEMRSWYDEGEEAFARAADHLRGITDAGEEKTAVLGKALGRQGWFNLRLAHFDQANELLQQSLALLRPLSNETDLAFTLSGLGIVTETLGHYPQAKTYQEESLQLYRSAGDHWGITNSLIRLGNTAIALSELRQAREYYSQALDVCEQTGNLRGVALCLNNLGQIAERLGERDTAEELFQESLEIKKELGDRTGMAYSLNNLGYLSYQAGNYQQALSQLQDSLAVFSLIGDPRGRAYAFNNLGHVARALRQFDKAAELYQESNKIFREIGDPFGIAFTANDLGNVLNDLGQPKEAHNQFYEALRTMQSRHAPTALDALAGLAAVWGQYGGEEQAAELAAFVLNHPDSTQPARHRAQTTLTQLEAKLPPADLAAIRQRGESRELDSLVQALINQPTL
jgi:predicted ATPase/Tfp pilus assembly protein PilF